MKYRVILKVGYLDLWFDFDNVEEAIPFIKTIFHHQVENDDTKDRETSVRIEAIFPEAEAKGDE